jgi:hypothetical protein
MIDNTTQNRIQANDESLEFKGQSKTRVFFEIIRSWGIQKHNLVHSGG